MNMEQPGAILEETNLFEKEVAQFLGEHEATIAPGKIAEIVAKVGAYTESFEVSRDGMLVSYNKYKKVFSVDGTPVTKGEMHCCKTYEYCCSLFI